MELNGKPAALSDLIGLRVRDADGKTLGHVFELRARRDGDGFLVIDRILIGRRGLWKRLRGPAGRESGLPWESVTAIGDDSLTVRRS
ncbi:MAG TPA: PRC-barrel domain-containing protein [Solirubrobacterales bacterium]|jgi:sporulation protein YlmC with PRC-barrel domain|nr:PRC-barrel domain-containing protein [Solirubrobacterales bacterium]